MIINMDNGYKLIVINLQLMKDFTFFDVVLRHIRLTNSLVIIN
jgi:hypothetical protein